MHAFDFIRMKIRKKYLLTAGPGAVFFCKSIMGIICVTSNTEFTDNFKE